MSAPIRVHPGNPKLFEFRGQPRVLLTASEHYGAVMNRPFRFERYLADAAEKGMTLTRLFLLFRELQTPINPYSTCKPESPDYIAPFERTGPGRAEDGELKFDLDRPNPEFFERLHRFLALASDYGIIVEVVLLSNTYAPAVWALNPLKAENNINGLAPIEWPQYMSQQHASLFARQAAHVRRIVEETNRYDNVLYEICNEPCGGAPGDAGNPSVEAVNQWLSALIRVVRETEAALPQQHLVVGQEACHHTPFKEPLDLTFRGLDYDVVNVHALPAIEYAGQHYHLGDFMSKQLRLRALRALGLATYAEPKPVNQDEDNIASQYKDDEAWTLHRKRAWTTLLTGGHYDMIDFSIINYCEAGTPASRAHLRTWFKHLSTFIHSLDLVRARPLPERLLEQPAHTLDVVFGVAGEDECIYLADERELASARDLPAGEAGAPGAGQALSGHVALTLSPGTYEAASFDPETGLYSPGVTVRSEGGAVRLAVPRFVDDVVVRVRRVG
jgi:hypothetical protein